MPSRLLWAPEWRIGCIPLVGPEQWRTQKIFMRGFGSRSYGGYLFLVCAVCDVTI